MSQNSTALPERGKTYFQGQDAPAAADYGATAQLEGMQGIFPDVSTVKEGASLRAKTSGREVHCMLVRKTGTDTLSAGMPVHWTDGYKGRRVSDPTAANGASLAGYVDDKLTGTVREGDLFWIMRKGPTRLIGADGSYAVNDAVAAATTGSEMEVDATPDIYRNGHVITAATVSSGVPLVSVDLAIDW